MGSSPTTRTKRPKRSFLFGGTFVLCTTNAKAFGTHTVWLAPVSPCPSAESSSHLTARPTTRTKRPKRSFLFGGTFVLCTTNAKAFGTHTVWLAPVSPCPSAESSSHLTARPTTRTKRPKRSFLFGEIILQQYSQTITTFKFSQYDVFITQF